MEVKVGRNRAANKPAAQGGYAPKMSVDERDGLWREKEGLEALRRDISYETNPEKDAVENRIRQLGELLGADSDAEAKGRKKDQMRSRMTVLAGKIKVAVPPLSIQQAKPGTPEYSKAIQWGQDAMKPEVTQMCEEYQALARSLEPENPEAGSIEALVSQP